MAGCASFDSLPPASVFVVGDTFMDGDVKVAVRRFQTEDGSWIVDGDANVGPADDAGGAGQEIGYRNVCLAFTFPGVPVAGVTLLYVKSAGNLNISINSDFNNVGGFDALDGLDIGGAHVTTDPPATDPFGPGKLVLDGAIRSFALGGVELSIDDVCFV
jgi:hypothetical protein